MKIYPFRAAVGFLVLFLSIILLLTTADVVPWNIWLFVWQFWPMLFVIFGMAFLMRRWNVSFYLGIPIFILIFGIMGTGLWKTWEDQYFNTENFAEENIKGMTESKVSNEMPKNTEKADIKIRLGAGDIKVGSIPDEGSTLIYTGTHNSNFFSLNQRLETVGKNAKVNFQTSPFIKRPFSSKGVNELNLSFSQKLDYTLEVESGTSDIDLSLEKLKISKLELDTGASNVTTMFGELGSTDVKVKSGASSLKFYIPKDSGVRVTSKSALTSNNFEDFGLVKTKKSWESKNWADAKNKINIELGSGASKIELLR